jgi:AraC family transcriptional regulator
MIRQQPFFESPLVAVVRVDHPPGVPHEDPKEEVSSQYSISFVERGGFGIHKDDRTWAVGPTDVFVTFPGFVCQFHHDDDECGLEDVCLAIRFQDEDAATLADLGIAALAQHAPVVSLTNRRAYLRDRLVRHTADGTTPLAVESIAGELLVSTLRGVSGRRLFRSNQLRWYATRVDATRERLDAEYASSFTLSTLAKDAGMSAYHFARVFSELAGLPPHRYLVQRRLDAAAGRLTEGSSVTDACFAVGFNSLSHFDRSFRKAFGVSPSHYRGAAL